MQFSPIGHRLSPVRPNPEHRYPASTYKVLNAPNFGVALEKLIDLVPVLVETAWNKHNRMHGREALDYFLGSLKKVHCVNVREKTSAAIVLYDKDMFDNFWIDAQSSFACKKKQFFVLRSDTDGTIDKLSSLSDYSRRWLFGPRFDPTRSSRPFRNLARVGKYADTPERDLHFNDLRGPRHPNFT